jgi:hypothetical protein
MSLELFINSGSIPEIDLSKIEGVRFEDVFSVASTTCATLKYNTGTFIYPTVTSPVVLSIPQTNYFMFDEDCSSDWDGTTPRAIRLNLKALGRLPETTNYQQKLFEIIRDRLVDSEITIKKLSTISELDPPSYKTFHISEASYLERVYDNTGEKFYAMEWGSTVLTETADFLGLFNYLPASSDAKDGFFTLVVTQTDTSAPELPAEDDELLICITPSKKYGFFEGVSGSFDSINITNVDITSASMESLLIDGTVNVTGSLIVNGDDLKVTVGRTRFGSLLINYDTDTSVDPGNNYFKYSTGPGESPNELALSMVIYDNGTFVKEAYNYEKTWTEIVDKKYYGSTITLKNLNSLDYKVLKINSAESINAPNGFIKFGVTEIEAGQDAFRLPRIDDEYSIDFDIKLETKTIEKTVFTQSGQYTVPVWAKTITVIAIGGGGGGGGGVGILKNANYSLYEDLDSVDLYDFYMYKYQSYGKPLTRSETNKGPINDFKELIGGGGGAGGNVVWKFYRTNENEYINTIEPSVLPILTTCNIYVGKGGKGYTGGYGAVINRYLVYPDPNDPTLSRLEWDGYDNPQTQYDIPKFKVDNSVGRIGVVALDFDADDIIYGGGKMVNTSIFTRGGYEKFDTSEKDEPENKRKKHYIKLTNSGGDSIFSFERNGIEYRVRAEGGFGGSSGYALPNKPVFFRHRDRAAGIRYGYIVPEYLFDDNGPVRHPRWYADPGPTHDQNRLSGDYDAILLGGPGGHGTSMSFYGYEEFFNSAPNFPWIEITARRKWGTKFIEEKPGYSINTDLGYIKPSDYAPAGGGGGNGPNQYILERRDAFMIENPGQDIDDLETYKDGVIGNYGFGHTFIGTNVGIGGKPKISFIFGDIPLGVGGDSGNFLTYPPKGIVPSLPTPGGLYGGGGGGGASLFFDIGTNDDEVKGQDGADGGDGVVVIIAEN